VSDFLNCFQIRAARNALNLGVRELGSLVGVSRTIIYRLEHGTIKLNSQKQGVRFNDIFIWFFKKNYITFNNNYSMSWDGVAEDPHPKQIEHITRFQLRSARALLNQDRMLLSKTLQINVGVLERAEELSNSKYINPKDVSVAPAIKKYFLQQGITFPDNGRVNFKRIVDESIVV
jgi:transcriptional regulator with XRE-family HTH domain